MSNCIGNWICVKQLGCGAFGDVNLWKHAKNNTLVAVKTCRVILSDLNKEERLKLVQRWNNEVDIMSKMYHENLIHACPELCQDLLDEINSEVDRQLPAIAMEYCEAGSLRDKLKEKPNVNGLSEFDVRGVLRALSNGVKYLHNTHKITHRDIKPDNIILKARSDGKIIYKLTDVGYARDIDAKTIQASMVGTKNYFAPEIVINAEYKNSVDYWSVGVVAFEIMCGIHPFLPGESFCNVMRAIQTKEFDCIAITKDFGNSLRCHNELPPENRVSGTFAELLVPWLRLALEKNGHVRGRDAGGALIFYTQLEAVLDTKILTVFWINKCQFLSYNLAKFETMQSLYERIDHDTNSGGTPFELFFAEGHACYQMTTNPIHLYDEHLLENDKPMMYLVTFTESTLCNPGQPLVPSTILQLFSLADESVTTAVLQQCFLHNLYMHQNEARKCYHLLNGLKEFAMNLEDAMVKHKPMVSKFKDKILECSGQASHYESMVTTGMELCEEKFSDGFLNSMMEENAKYANYFKNLCAENLMVCNSFDNILVRIRHFIQQPQAEHCRTAFLKIKQQVEKLVPRPSADSIREDAASLITVRKEFIDTVRNWLTDTTVPSASNGATTCDILNVMWTEYIRIGGLLKGHEILFNDARVKVMNMTREYMEQLARPNEKPKSLEFAAIVQQMETLDISCDDTLSTDELVRELDFYQRRILDVFDAPMAD